MPSTTAASATSVNILNVGTRILLKDSMDQLIRTLGDFKTYYASNMGMALKAHATHSPQIIISEVDYPDGCAYRLLKQLEWFPEMDKTYVILAIEEQRPELTALAEELEVHSVIIKPFNATDIKYELEKFQQWKKEARPKWHQLLRQGHIALGERRYKDAEQHYFDSLKADPNEHTSHLRVGQYYTSKLEFQIAEKFLKRSLELKPGVESLSSLGSLYRKKKDYGLALEFFEKAHAICPLQPDRILEMIAVRSQLDIELCKDALKLDPGLGSARVMLSKLYALLQDYPSAVREGEIALSFVTPEQKSEAQTFIALARKLGSLEK